MRQNLQRQRNMKKPLNCLGLSILHTPQEGVLAIFQSAACDQLRSYINPRQIAVNLGSDEDPGVLPGVGKYYIRTKIQRNINSIGCSLHPFFSQLTLS